MDIREFAQALQSKDPSRYTRWFADDIQPYTPITRSRLWAGKQYRNSIDWGTRRVPDLLSVFRRIG